MLLDVAAPKCRDRAIMSFYEQTDNIIRNFPTCREVTNYIVDFFYYAWFSSCAFPVGA